MKKSPIILFTVTTSAETTLVNNNYKKSEFLQQLEFKDVSIQSLRQFRIQKHPFHLVKPSFYPIISSIGVFGLVSFIAHKFHDITAIKKWNDYAEIMGLSGFDTNLMYFYGHIEELWWLPLFLWGIIGWFNDVIRESTIERQHTLKVRKGLRAGMILFIVSEVFFFFSFFWGFFHSALTPAVSIGCQWPPKGIHPIEAFGLPLLNTVILLSSGVSVTWAHRAILANLRNDGLIALIYTVFLGGLFTACQIYEYINAPFSINDGIYGSIFYVATGFHGLHVIIGTIFLCVCLGRHYYGHFTAKIHLGFEFAAWYWHFVDVVWLFLFVSIYWWGGKVAV